jgi:uncharacterized protein YndB with AHSA1/START domain
MSDEITRGEDLEVRRFERRLAHRPEKVWRALTERREMTSWFPAKVDGTVEKGARLRFAFHEGAEAEAEGVVRECEPPHLLVFTMGDETLRWELTPLGEGGSLLVLTTTRRVGSAANDNAVTARMAA